MRAALLVLALVLAGCAAPSPVPSPLRLPSSMAALGDSITRAVNADAPGEQLQRSWATGGANDSIDSFAERLARLSPALVGRVHNDAQPGARAADLAEQARRAVEQRVDLVVVLVGANDACRRSGATPPGEFRADVRDAFRILADGLPDARVLVLSIPDVGALVELGENDSAIRQRWSYYRPCPALLGNVTDEERDALLALVDAYNGALREESAAVGFRWDDGAVHAGKPEKADLSPIDAFHPSVRGQAKLAQAAWDASWWGGIETTATSESG